MTSSNPNSSPTTQPTFRPFAAAGRRKGVRLVPTNTIPGDPTEAPAAPSSLSGSIFPTSINLTWADNSVFPNTATSFTYEWQVQGVWQSATTTATSATITGLAEATGYPVRVRANNAVGSSSYASSSPPVTGILAPTNLSVSVTGTTVNISWTDASLVETEYRVERSSNGGTSYSLVATTAADASSYADTNRPDGTYKYRVAAVRPFGQSEWTTQPGTVTVASVPAAPTGLSVSGVTNTRLDLSWNDIASNETGYVIERRLMPSGSFSQIAAIAADEVSYRDNAIQESRQYEYRVAATNAAGTSAYSNTVSVWTVPNAPTSLDGFGSFNTAYLYWTDNSTGNTGYRIERRLPGGTFALIANTTNQNSYGDGPNLAAGSTYEYRVAATNATQTSAWSNTFSVTMNGGLGFNPGVPAAPSNLVATATGSSTISLSWTDNANNETGFAIERSTDNVNWTVISEDEIGPNGTSYSAVSLNASTLYYFRVKAENEMGWSPYSNTASATTQAATTVPNAPSAFNATSTFADSVSLSWTDNSSGTGQETGFDIEVSTNAGSTYSSVTTTAANATSFSHTGRVESTTYLYRIRATNSAGSSSWVVGDNVTTTAAITGFTATAASSTQINLAWTDKSGVETGFRVEYSEDNFNWSLLTTTAANATSYSNTLLNPSTTYWYRVRSNSYNGTNDSAWYTATATTQAAGLPTPTFEVNFTTDPYVGTRFSRAGRGTFINSSGFIQVAEVNEALHSEDMSNWAALNSSVTVNSTAAPDGSLTADRIVETAISGRHGVYRGASVSTANVPSTASIYVKKDTRSFFHMQWNLGGGRLSAIWNLDSGTVSDSLITGGFTSTSIGITSVGNGWYRVSMTGTMNGTSGNLLFGPCDRATFAGGTLEADSPVYTGSSSEGVFVWGAAASLGTLLPYVRTTTTGVGAPRITHDPVTLDPLGLLMEAQATNLCLQSETVATGTGVTVTADTVTSPANTLTADTLVEAAGTSFHHGAKTFTIAAGTRYTASVFVKNPAGSRNGFIYMTVDFGGGTATGYAATFDIANGTLGGAGSTTSRGSPSGSHGIENYGNGWYRIWVSATSDATNTNAQIYYGGTPSMTPTWFANYVAGWAVNAGDEKPIALMWGFQIETGSTATSYIPTTTAAATRNVDTWVETNSVFNVSAGTVFADVFTNTTSSLNCGLDFLSSSTGQNNRVSLRKIRSIVSSGGTNVADAQYSTTPSRQKDAVAFALNDFAAVRNATTPLTDNTGAVPVGLDRLRLDVDGAFHGGHIFNSVKFWNQRLSNANLQTITTNNDYAAQVLVVAGGGGGGSGAQSGANGGAGGGAGGHLSTSSYSLTPGTSYSVVVGAGGAGNTNGNDSVFATARATGGGRGGFASAGSAGGSGGGGARAAGGSGTLGQGNSGGTGASGWPDATGGGGGAGGVGIGGNNTTQTAGAGGPGAVSSITGTAVTRAGGGGGSTHSGTPGAGGSGGGGVGAGWNGTGGNGTVNTGSGGGGTTHTNAGSGGSGVVVVRVPTSRYTGTFTGSPVVTTSGSDTVMVFNSSGSYTA